MQEGYRGCEENRVRKWYNCWRHGWYQRDRVCIRRLEEGRWRNRFKTGEQYQLENKWIVLLKFTHFSLYSANIWVSRKCSTAALALTLFSESLVNWFVKKKYYFGLNLILWKSGELTCTEKSTAMAWTWFSESLVNWFVQKKVLQWLALDSLKVWWTDLYRKKELLWLECDSLKVWWTDLYRKKVLLWLERDSLKVWWTDLYRKKVLLWLELDSLKVWWTDLYRKKYFYVLNLILRKSGELTCTEKSTALAWTWFSESLVNWVVQKKSTALALTSFSKSLID